MEEMKKWEVIVLNTINFKLDVISIEDIINNLISSNALVFNIELEQIVDKTRALKEFKILTLDIAKKFYLGNEDSLNYSHDSIAFCSIFIGKRIFNIDMKTDMLNSRQLLEYIFDDQLNEELVNKIYKHFINDSDYKENLEMNMISSIEIENIIK